MILKKLSTLPFSKKLLDSPLGTTQMKNTNSHFQIYNEVDSPKLTNNITHFWLPFVDLRTISQNPKKFYETCYVRLSFGTWFTINPIAYLPLSQYVYHFSKIILWREIVPEFRICYFSFWFYIQCPIAIYLKKVLIFATVWNRLVWVPHFHVTCTFCHDSRLITSAYSRK